MVVVTDDEYRENEGDVIIATETGMVEPGAPDDRRASCRTPRADLMSEHVNKSVEVTGSSTEGIDDAVRTAVERRARAFAISSGSRSSRSAAM